MQSNSSPDYRLISREKFVLLLCEILKINVKIDQSCEFEMKNV